MQFNSKRQRPNVETKRLTLGLTNYQDIKQAHSMHPTRTLSTFLQDQDKFLTNKMRRIAQLRRQKEEMQVMECTGSPTIDPMSHHLSQRMQHSRQSAFQRLSHHPPTPTQQSTTHLFTPKILSKSKSLHRKENISQLLYDDARRRQQKEALLSEEKNRRQEASPAINHNTNALVEKKLLSQFNELVSAPTLNPLVALSVLCELFHLTIHKDSEYCERLLSFLRDKSSGCVQVGRLWAFVQVVLHGQSKEDVFSQEERQQISSMYQHFYQVRLTKEKKVQSPERLSFRPKTLVSSRKMAQVHRERICDAVNEFVTEQQIQLNLKNNTMKIEDLFIIDDLKRKASNQKRRMEKETKELEQCSFKPNLKDSSITLKNLKKKPKITVTLQSRKKVLEQVKNVEQRQVLRVIQNRGRSVSHKEKKMVRDMEKVVLRLSVGRKNREYENKVHARGYAADENYVEYKKEAHRDVIESHRKLKGY